MDFDQKLGAYGEKKDIVKSWELRENKVAPPRPVMVGRGQEGDVRVAPADPNWMLGFHGKRVQRVKDRWKKLRTSQYHSGDKQAVVDVLVNLLN